jgi:hypothetical protein
MRPASLLLTLAIPVCLCGTASAQEREIWACQGVESAGLDWENGSWKVTRFIAEPLLLTIDGANSNWKRGSGSERNAICTDRFETVSCVASVLGTEVVALNREQGLAAHSFLGGGVMSPSASGERDSISVSAYNCSKF